MRKYCVVLPVFIALVACGHAETPVTKVDRPALTFVIGNLGDSGGTVYSGEVRARHESVLGFRLGGKILARLVDVGAFVKKGQLIARLDQADAQLQQEAAAAQQVLAENELKRYRDLRTKGFVSQSALDVKEASFKQSSAQAGLAGNLAEYTSLTADSDGIVTAVLAEAGQVVSAGQAIVRVAKRGEREVAISIPEAHYAALKIGMPATIELPASQGSTAKYRGRLRELSPAADPASRTYAARVTFSNADRNVALGMTATVQIGT
ncbi:MAG: efflux RND transporter periplasmic adaptor subunit, partial [Gallionella sp.]